MIKHLPNLQSESKQTALSVSGLESRDDIRRDISNQPKISATLQSEIEKQRKEATDYIAIGKASGFKFNSTRTPTIPCDFPNSILSIFDSHFEGNSVISSAQYILAGNVQVSPDLRYQNETEISTIFVRAEKINNKFRVSLVDVLNNDKPILFQKDILVDKNNKIDEEFAKNLKDKIDIVLINYSKTLREEIKSIQPSNKKYEISAKTIPGTEESAKEILSLAKAGYTLSISFAGRTKAIDQIYGENQDLVAGNSLILNPQNLKNISDNKVSIDGSIQRIILNKEFKLNSSELTTEDKEKLLKENIIKRSRDEYGNNLSRVIYISKFDRQKENPIVSETISIQIPNQIASSDKMQPLKIDMTGIGLNKISNIFEITPLTEQYKIGKTSIIASETKEVNLAEVKKSISQFKNGTSIAEEAFGFNIGSLVKNIYLANSNSSNAFFSSLNPNTVVVLDKILNEVKDPTFVGFHETVHLIDGASEWKLSSGGFEKTFEKLRKNNSNIFELINESKFLPNNVLGGHSQEDPKELLATICNTLQYLKTDPEGWKKNISKFSDNNKKEYLEIISQLKNNFTLLNGKEFLSEKFQSSCPFGDLIDNAIKLLK